MPVTVIVGGQFGGEGKGKVAHCLTRDEGASVVVRVGGTNSGHTVIDPDGNPVIFRQLPTPAILPDVICVLPAGTYINPEILLEEVDRIGLPPTRLIIDPNASIITDEEILAENQSALRSSIGSTLSGTGAAVQKRISRENPVRLAKDDDRLREYIQPTASFLRDKLSDGERIIIEGTQGFGLSLLHSGYYPFVTSRDTTAAAFVAEAGLSPLDVDDIVMVIRAYPIRVGGNSGPLPNEIDWQTVTHEAESTEVIREYTSVTKTERRVARFDAEIVLCAIRVNQPTRIILNHLDHIDIKCKKSQALTLKSQQFLNEVESSINRPIDYIGFDRVSLTKRNKTSLKAIVA